MTNRKSNTARVDSSLRGRLIATAKPKPPRSWFEKLQVTNPLKANEIKSLCDEWASSPSSELRTVYPSRYAFAKAISAETGASPQTVVAQFVLWGIECQ